MKTDDFYISTDADFLEWYMITSLFGENGWFFQGKSYFKAISMIKAIIPVIQHFDWLTFKEKSIE